VQHANTEKPVRRLWLQSMTQGAIREGFAHLRTTRRCGRWPTPRAAAPSRLADRHQRHARHDRLQLARGRLPQDAGRPRADADAGHPGRARGAHPRPPSARLLGSEGEFAAVGRPLPRPLVRREIRKSDDEHARPERLWDIRKAEAIRKKCLGKHGTVEEESKPTTQLSPLLFDLTSLQREANGRFGFSAKTTLALAQALYEKHKALTYPRTDSRYLPEDYVATVKETLKSFSGTPYAPFAGQILKGGWAHPNKRIFNNAKVSDHFAIIPTGAEPKHLSEAEQKLYDLVTGASSPFSSRRRNTT
jgi:DNA topoisomerase-3